MRYITPVIIATAATVLSTAPAHADIGDQLIKLLSYESNVADEFGISVAIGGPPGKEVVIVGAKLGNVGTNWSGLAFLFDAATGEQLFKLVPSDGATNDNFGLSVAISETTALVGAEGHDDNGGVSGSAYLFDITTGEQIFELLPIDGESGDHFGYSVAIGGNPGNEIAIIGAHLDDDNGIYSGSVYIFDVTTGQQISKLLPNDGDARDQFGGSVAISGTTAIIGAHRDDDNGDGSGSAYIFDTTTGKQLFKLSANDGDIGDKFGSSVAISNSLAVVGSPWDRDIANTAGSAYIFDTTTGQQLFKLLPFDGSAESDRFGNSVGISGTTAVVGMLYDDDNGTDSGSAYLFSATTGTQITKLLPSDGASTDVFGKSVAIGGAPGNEIAIVGAYHDDDNGIDSGSAYIFDASGAFTPCPWDLNFNRVVEVADLLLLFAQWGTDGPANFDGHGFVDVKDLLILFANWGPCP